MKKDFFFQGSIAPSKSIFNRYLICQSYQQDLIIQGDSHCDDVQLLRQALVSLNGWRRGEPLEVLHCGAAGTVLRFLALRLSRLVGGFTLQATSRLWQRDLGTLQALLAQLGTSTHFENQQLHLECRGWQETIGPLICRAQLSSQYLSGLLLNAWGLPFALELGWDQLPSAGYFQMTIEVVRGLGMQVAVSTSSLNKAIISPQQTVREQQVTVESDLSSIFAIAALAALAGEAHFQQFPLPSLQPDRVFVDMLQQMGVVVELDRSVGKLTVQQGQVLRPIHWDLRDCPDLFPVLSVLCSFAEGTSILAGAPHLKLKESDRLAKTAELLALMEKKFERRTDGLVIYGDNNLQTLPVEFDPGDDHRMVFAAELFNWRGGQVTILRPHVVEKSFPEYWQIIEVAHA